MIIAPLVADDGADNTIDLTATLDQAYFDALKANSDYSKRYQFTPIIDNIVPNIQDDTTEETAFGRTIVNREGRIGYEIHWNADLADPVFQRALDSLKCDKWGFHFVDKCDSIAGYKCGDKLELIPISEGTVSVKKMETEPGSSDYIRLIFQIDPSGENDYDILLGEDLDDASILGIKPLYSGELNSKVSATTTDLVVDLQAVSGSAISIPYTGADTVGNWKMQNVTASTTVAITTVVEDAVIDGRYTFTFPAQTASDTVKLTYLDDKGEIIFTTTLD